MKEFQMMRLKAYSKVSLKRPLTTEEFKDMKSIADELNIKGGCIPKI